MHELAIARRTLSTVFLQADHEDDKLSFAWAASQAGTIYDVILPTFFLCKQCCVPRCQEASLWLSGRLVS